MKLYEAKIKEQNNMLEYMLKMNKVMHAETEKELTKEMDVVKEKNRMLKQRQFDSEGEVGRLRGSLSSMGEQVGEMERWFKLFTFESERYARNYNRIKRKNQMIERYSVGGSKPVAELIED